MHGLDPLSLLHLKSLTVTFHEWLTQNPFSVIHLPSFCQSHCQMPASVMDFEAQVDEAALFGHGKLGRVNAEKGMPGPKCESLF
jgi:hypothetical protein